MDNFDFVILGLANCFQRDEDNQLTPVMVIEPIPSAAFLTLLQDIPSSFSLIRAVDPNSLFDDKGAFIRPQGFPDEAIVPNDFIDRLKAAARTFQYKPEAQIHLKIGQERSFDNQPKQKRIINQDNVVSDDDNIKQHPLTFKKV